MWRHGIVPNVIAYNAGRQHQQPFHLLRAVQRHAIEPERITNIAASVRGKKALLYPQA